MRKGLELRPHLLEWTGLNNLNMFSWSWVRIFLSWIYSDVWSCWYLSPVSPTAEEEANSNTLNFIFSTDVLGSLVSRTVLPIWLCTFIFYALKDKYFFHFLMLMCEHYCLSAINCTCSCILPSSLQRKQKDLN